MQNRVRFRIRCSKCRGSPGHTLMLPEWRKLSGRWNVNTCDHFVDENAFASGHHAKCPACVTRIVCDPSSAIDSKLEFDFSDGHRRRLFEHSSIRPYGLHGQIGDPDQNPTKIRVDSIMRQSFIQIELLKISCCNSVPTRGFGRFRMLSECFRTLSERAAAFAR